MITAISIDGGKTWIKTETNRIVAIKHDNGVIEFQSCTGTVFIFTLPEGFRPTVTFPAPVTTTCTIPLPVEVTAGPSCMLCDPMCRDCPLRER